jgi:SsrA-binding protein
MNLLLNRKVRYEFSIIEEFDAGIILTGGEVKGIRAKNARITDSFIYIKDGEAWVKNLHISRYKQEHKCVDHLENRDKKLLLTKKQIAKIVKKTSEKGITCVPISIFIKNNRLKIKIGVVKGKKMWDKKETIKNRDISIEVKRQTGFYV